jgi:hypothetical protein
MLEMDYPGRTVAVIPVGNPPRPSPLGSPKGIDPDYRKFDRALKTPMRPVLLSLQRSPFRDFSAEEFLGRDVLVSAEQEVFLSSRRRRSHQRQCG